ncbi:MAG: ATP-dependent Clp protease adapter ClpS [Clostridia bacterium]|nr:ATP-dependent Clp protease adapter ClpS [Clostridia bacterium]
MSEQTIFKEKVDTKLQKPRMYRVILLNDDYTTMEFVVEVLVTVFHKQVPEATKIMLDVHEKGKGIVGIYTYDIAATKIAQAEEMARENEFPLKAIMEEV